MARTVRNAKIDTRSARVKLSERREPYWTVVSQGRAIGYRKGRKGGTWVARYRDAAGKHHYQAIGAADDALDANGSGVIAYARAQEIARAWFGEMARRDAGSDSTGPYTVTEAMDDYMKWFRAHKKSVRDTEYAIKAHIKPKLGDVEIRKLSTVRLRDWHRGLAAAPARLRSARGKAQQFRHAPEDPEAGRPRRASANRILSVLKAALNHAWREGKVESDDPWRRVSPFRQANAARVRYLSQAECQRLVNSCEKTLRPLVQAALHTGCRYGELGALRAGDFNPDAGTLQIRSSKAGKPRYVVLTEDGQGFFARLVAGAPKDRIMLSRGSDRTWGKSHQARPLLEACRRAKISPAVSFHVLRHTYASHLAMSGIPLPVVAVNLGHTDTRMVEKHYAHLAKSYIADTIRASAPTLGTKSRSNIIPIEGRKQPVRKRAKR